MSRTLLPLPLLLACLAVAVPQPPAPRQVPDLYRHALAATAWVEAPGSGKGTAWVVDVKKRRLITCYHVVGECKSVEVVFPEGGFALRSHYLGEHARLVKRGLILQGKVIQRDPKHDLALIEVPSLPPGVQALTLRDTPAEPGEDVCLVGNRYDLPTLWNFSRGVVRQRRMMSEGYFTAGQRLAKGATLLAATVPINEGDSGAALIDQRGFVVGVAAAVGWRMHGAGLFIDLRDLRSFLGQKASLPATNKGRNLFHRMARATVMVRIKGRPIFAGVVLDHGKGLVLTTSAAVAREKTVDILLPVWQGRSPVSDARFYASERALLQKRGALLTGIVLATDPRLNLALLQVPRFSASVTALSLANDAPRPGDRMHLLSHPPGLDVLWVYASGPVRQVGTANLGQVEGGVEPGVIFVQAPLGEGEGGGPVCDERGHLVALLTGKVGPQQQVVLALPAREISSFVDRFSPLHSPTTAEQFVHRAALYRRAYLLDRARADLDAALKIAPRHAAALVARAEVWRLTGRVSRAIADADLALKVTPTLPAAHVQKALALLDKGEDTQALASANKSLARDRKFASAYAARALILLRRGKRQSAKEDADEAIWHDAKLALAYEVRGQVHQLLGQSDKALADFDTAILYDPHLARTYRLRAWLRWQRSELPQALEDCNRALKRDPSDASAWLLCGRIRAARGDRKAIEDIETALRLAPWFAPAWLKD